MSSLQQEVDTFINNMPEPKHDEGVEYLSVYTHNVRILRGDKGWPVAEYEVAQIAATFPQVTFQVRRLP